MLPETMASLLAPPQGWPVQFVVWLVLWTPVVALLEYATHRWIMHLGNRLLDPELVHLKAHGMHHQGMNDDGFVDIRFRDCLLLTAPVFLLLAIWGLTMGPVSADRKS